MRRLYPDPVTARAAVADLRASGFADADISYIGGRDADEDTEASSSAAGAVVGTAVGAGAGTLAGLGMIAIPGAGPLVAAGWLATMLTGAGVGAAAGAAAGGLIDALTGSGIPEDEATRYVAGLREGGSLVIVRGVAESRIEAATSILERHRPVALRAAPSGL
ncbi:hypothetical protein GWK16_09320 [Roseomonas sp. JC162]|uniref:DUF1269 domain-containing protein n=1 Tax=Neoroseomonas marina TaxID=1232220 RepID=A0A848EDP7_9PROT|nr:hypothetical protein [Neoroseomonas marina]NMJ41438.1 hypothetical protein [Neoroseomonas marina]